jgi:hypothetical protein
MANVASDSVTGSGLLQRQKEGVQSMELVLLSAAGVIPGVVTAVVLLYLVTRGLPQRRDSFSAVKAFFVYCYFMIGLSTVATVVGLVMLANILFKVAFEVDWIRNDLWLACVTTAMGVLICILHLAAKRDVRKRIGENLTTARRVYVTWMTFLFGFSSFVSLTVAVYQLVHYYRAPIVPAAPTTETAMATVLVIVWLYYMFRLRREASRGDQAGALPSDGKPGASQSAAPERGREVEPPSDLRQPGG